MPTREEKNQFSEIIVSKAERDCSSCIEAIVLYCEETGLEIEVAASLINDVLKSRLHEEAISLRYIEKRGKLPL